MTHPHHHDDPRYPVRKTEAEWRAQLSPEQYRVARQAATERPFTGKYWNHTASGQYLCAGCGAALFESATKFDAGCGWPSYWEPLDSQVVERVRDSTLGMVRVEVRCNRCGSHLGHVFDDGPEPTGERFCINSAAIDFKADAKPAPQAGMSKVAKPHLPMGADQIEARLRAALAPTHIEVLDDSHLHAGHAGAREGRHFTVKLASARFTGLSRLARHRLVYDSLGPLAEQGVHALAIVARAPDEA